MVKRPRHTIKIRLTREKLEALHCICDDMMKEFVPENETEYLMLEYMKELHHDLSKKIKLDQNIYTLHMTGTEAVAFRQLWNVFYINNDKYAGILVRSVLGQIDRYKDEQLIHKP